MLLNISFDQAVNSLPTGFVSAVNYVVNYFDHLFNDPITINIDVGYGEVGGSPLDQGALGESLTFLNTVSYTTLRNALLGDARSPDDTSAVASLPGGDPIGGTHTYWMSTAEQKAVGLLAGNNSSIDGYVGFSSTAPFDYDRSNGISAGSYDFIGTVEHEISEVMGRVTVDGGTIGPFANSYEPLDLFHYSSAGVRDFSGTTPGYFSVDSGNTNLDNFSTNPNGDFGDWAASAGHDAALAFSSSGVLNNFTGVDVRAMDVLGYDLAPAAAGVLNSAGASDILLQNGQQLAEWQMNGTAIQPGSGSIGTLGTGWAVAGTGDFNNDGHADLLLQNGQQLAEWQMNGTAIQPGSGGIGTLGAGGVVAGTGDFNGDGTADILLQNGQQLSLWEMNGTTIQPGSGGIGTLGAGWAVAGNGDFNGDGTADILLQNGQQLALWEMNGTTIQPGSGSIGTLGAGWTVAGTGDFNNDGHADILLQNGQQLAEWLMNGTAIQPGSGGIGTLGAGWTVAGTGDFNNDGHADILLQNGQQLAGWLMNGTAIQPGSGSIGTLGAGWHPA